MTTEPLRRRSLFPAATQPQPALSEAEIADVATRNGFAAVSSAPAAGGPERADENLTLKRKRQPTGRDFQFNVRLRRETIDFIYKQANERDVPIAQVIEEMAEALRTKQS